MNKNYFSHLKILDHSRYLLGSYATQFFADLGAEVIKIEDVKNGDLSRTAFTPERNDVNYYFAALNRNKKSLSLNLKSEAGKAAYLKLIKDADIVIENFRPGVLERMGIEYNAMKAINSRIIHCSMTSFGIDDPRSLKALHDINFQALSGYLSLNSGVVSPIHFVDIATAMIAIQSIMAALLQRTFTGEGSYCDVRMFDSFVWWNSLVDSRFDFNGGELSAETLDLPSLCYNIYSTKDNKKISIGMIERKFWAKFCEAQGLNDIEEHHMSRRIDAPKAFERLEVHFKTKTYSEWTEWFNTQDVCVMPVYSVGEAIDYMVSSQTGLMEYLDFPQTGKTLQTNIPHYIDSLPVSLKDAKPNPKLGEHNAQILGSLGYTAEQINSMASNGDCGPIVERTSEKKR